jgi:pyruvate kinase
LQGPKFRVGEIGNGLSSVAVKAGEVVEFGIAKNDKDLTVPGRVTMTATIEQVALVKASNVGETLLIDDGKLSMTITEKKSNTELVCKFMNAGLIKARKGVNAPDVEIDCAALPKKDVEDAEFMLGLDPIPEYFCVSFVQKAGDLQELIDIMDRMKIPQEKRPKICPKIEKPQALTNLDSIMALSHSLMIARGDLGVELGHERVPIAQKLLTNAALKAGLEPVICATMMMESMIESPVPTRAEVSDCFNAVCDGCHAVMLSGESATGDYPCEAVRMQVQIAKEAEYWLANA